MRRAALGALIAAFVCLAFLSGEYHNRWGDQTEWLPAGGPIIRVADFLNRGSEKDARPAIYSAVFLAALQNGATVILPPRTLNIPGGISLSGTLAIQGYKTWGGERASEDASALRDLGWRVQGCTSKSPLGPGVYNFTSDLYSCPSRWRNLTVRPINWMLNETADWISKPGGVSKLIDDKPVKNCHTNGRLFGAIVTLPNSNISFDTLSVQGICFAFVNL